MKCTVNKDVSFRVSPMAAFILRRNQELTCNKTKRGYRVWLTKRISREIPTLEFLRVFHMI